MATKLPNVSILTAGEAKGHDLLIDQTSLEQALAVAKSMGRIKVTNGHGAKQVMDILGFVENFSIKGNQLMGDLTLLNSDKAKYVQDLAEAMPDQFGLSLTFSGVPEVTEAGRMARVTEIYDVSVVAAPAANPAGMFSAFSQLRVDSVLIAMETKVEPIVAPVAELAAPVAEVKPTAAPTEKEPTLKDVVAMLSTILSYYKKDEEMSADEPETEVAPAPAPAPAVAVETAPEAAAFSSDASKIVALNNELSRLKIDLEASRGVVPLETAAPILSRADLLKQFNEEKNPSRAAAIYQKLNQLAR